MTKLVFPALDGDPELEIGACVVRGNGVIDILG